MVSAFFFALYLSCTPFCTLSVAFFALCPCRCPLPVLQAVLHALCGVVRPLPVLLSSACPASPLWLSCFVSWRVSCAISVRSITFFPFGLNCITPAKRDQCQGECLKTVCKVSPLALCRSPPLLEWRKFTKCLQIPLDAGLSLW